MTKWSTKARTSPTGCSRRAMDQKESPGWATTVWVEVPAGAETAVRVGAGARPAKAPRPIATEPTITSSDRKTPTATARGSKRTTAAGGRPDCPPCSKRRSGRRGARAVGKR